MPGISSNNEQIERSHIVRVNYIAQYVNVKCDAGRYTFSPGGVAKMDYFLYCLQQLGIETKVWSYCLAKEGVSRSRRSVTTYGQPLKYAFTFKPGIKGLTQLFLFILQVQLIFRLLFAKNNEVFFIYHERFYASVIKRVKRIRKLRIVIDIEEIYSIHAQLSQNKIRSEINYLEGFDRYTLANENLANELKLKAGDYVICNGVYAPILCHKELSKKDIFEVLYAGTFDKNKGGALAAIKAFELLDDKFRLYVCGFGSEAEINEVKNTIASINNIKGYQAIVYEGFIANSSRQYADLLERVCIGLSTQNNTGKYNATSFPSKIFEYLRHGIKVVSTRIPGSENLPISKYLTFIETNTADNIAKGVRHAAVADCSRECEALSEMHIDFINRFNKLLNA